MSGSIFHNVQTLYYTHLYGHQDIHECLLIYGYRVIQFYGMFFYTFFYSILDIKKVATTSIQIGASRKWLPYYSFSLFSIHYGLYILLYSFYLAKKMAELLLETLF